MRLLFIEFCFEQIDRLKVKVPTFAPKQRFGVGGVTLKHLFGGFDALLATRHRLFGALFGEVGFFERLYQFRRFLRIDTLCFIMAVEDELVEFGLTGDRLHFRPQPGFLSERR